MRFPKIHSIAFRPAVVSSLAALLLAAGWATREVAFAREKAEVLASRTMTLDQVKMSEFKDKGQKVGEIGIYLGGDTQASSKFVTGRFTIDPGKSPHAPHTHAEEEVMIIENGHGEIICDGKTTQVGPGSVMYTEPNVPHGINNTGKEPLTFTFVKWATK